MRMILFLILCLFLVMLGFAYYLGAFKKVTFIRELGPDVVLVFQKMNGPYKNSPKKMDEIYSWLEEQDIKTTQGFGIYYDNPQKVEEKKLRSVIGCILEKKDHNRIEEISKKFHVKHMPAQESVITFFPFKNKLSVIVGILKVYPNLAKYLTAENLAEGPVMEIYDMGNSRIEYYAFPGQGTNLLVEYFQAY